MVIQHLHIHHFRNLTEVFLDLDPRFTLIHGKNGSGKTSVLEALYFLTHLRSFRSSALENIIQQGYSEFTVYADAGPEWSAGVKKSLLGTTLIKLNGEKQKSIAAIARKIPTVLINADTFSLLEGGPEYRRQFVDWGVFHMEHSFLETWKSFQHALKQRNRALKQMLSDAEVQAWDEAFIQYGERMQTFRQAFFETWQPYLTALLPHLFTPEEAERYTLTYLQGWPKEESLAEVLKQNFFQDRRLKYTQYGPHRAELEIHRNTRLAKEVLSRGQQKLFVIALKLSQGTWLKGFSELACLYLLDDLPAELDLENRQKVLSCLEELKAQVVLTSVDPSQILESASHIPLKMFHMEQFRREA